MPTSPFASEAERLRAREALRVTIEAAHMEAEMPLTMQTAKMSRHLDRFDSIFPPMVDAPEEPPVNVPDGEFVNERYWCGCVRESRWAPRCERHKDNEHDEEPMTRGAERVDGPDDQSRSPGIASSEPCSDGAIGRHAPLPVANRDSGTSTPTPPDFDAALDAMERALGMVGWALQSETEEAFAAARQRVRELHEAVVRERDELRRRVQG